MGAVGIFVATIFKGPITMAAVGFLFKLGYFNFFLAYILMTLGDWVGRPRLVLSGLFRRHQIFQKIWKIFRH